METLSNKKVITRKFHNCWGCGNGISIGDTATRITNVDGGSLSSSYWCDVCVTFMNTLPSYETDDGFLYGELIEYPDHPFHAIIHAKKTQKIMRLESVNKK